MRRENWLLILTCMLICLLLAACAEDERYQKIEITAACQTTEEVLRIQEEYAGENTQGVPGDASMPEVTVDVGNAADAANAANRNSRSDLQDDGFDAAGQSVTLLFGGDVYLSSHVLNAYDQAGGDDAGGIGGVLDEGYRSVIADADFFFVNQEFPFSDRGVAAQDKQYTFRLAPERVSLMQQMGIDAVSLANNHALDYGTDALLDSCRTLDTAGILHAGAGADLEQAKQPVSFEHEISGIRVAVVAASRVFPEASWAAGTNHTGMLSAYLPETLLSEVRAAKETHDFVAAYVHWGIERDELPQDYQRMLGQQLIDAGADIVIGAHPHVLQGVEYYHGKPIVYSLGNFVFGSSIPRTALLRVTLEREKEPGSTEEGAWTDDPDGAVTGAEGNTPDGMLQTTLEWLPGTSRSGYTQQITDTAALEETYRYMEGISFGVSFADGMISKK